jgi:hypothetical protein
MLIDKKINFVKYYRDNPIDLATIADKLQVVYKLSNDSFINWSSDEYEYGFGQDFETLEKNGTYILINKNNVIPYELDNGTSDEIAEFVISKIQICIYKGLILQISSLRDNIETIYKLSSNGQFLRWNKYEYENGLSGDFEDFVENEIYLIFSKNLSYVLWPPLNFNKGKIINNDNVNWGLLEHLT